MRTQQDGSQLQAGRRALKGNLNSLGPRAQISASRTVRTGISFVPATRSIVLCYGSPRGLMHAHMAFETFFQGAESYAVMDCTSVYYYSL